jgi:hypothetical protein
MLYNQVESITDAFKLSVNTTHLLCETVDTPRSLAVSLMLQYQEWEEYQNLTMDHDAYEDPRHFALDYLCTEILRKHNDMPLGIDRPTVALNSFLDSERQCSASNERLKKYSLDWSMTFRKNISSLLGPLDGRALRFVEDSFAFGPGASTGVSGHGSSLSDKYDKPLHLTTGLIPFFKHILGGQWWEHHCKSVHVIAEGNKFTTVPKTAKTDRGICVEPTLNMYVQKGIGALIRRRLKRFGIDLNSQERNRQLAQLAHSHELCTIDLSAASDSLCSSLITEYFPPRWEHLLCIPRSDFCVLPNGESIELEKWSSMGNGYTFELETLVFYAVVRTFVPAEMLSLCSVYGDDIIVPRAYASEVIDALEFLGFKANAQKSFLAGNFFESCGQDFFKGTNVRPFYLKASKDKIPYRLQIANKLRRYCRQLNFEVSCDNTFEPVWNTLVRKIPRVWKFCRVPLSFGDSGLITSRDEAGPKKARDGIAGLVVRHMVLRPITRRKHSLGVLLAGLARVERMPFEQDMLEGEVALFSKGREPKRGFLNLPQPRKSIVQRWSSGLDWSQPLI